MFRGLITVRFFFHSDDEEIAISRVTIKYQKKKYLNSNFNFKLAILANFDFDVWIESLNPYLIFFIIS